MRWFCSCKEPGGKGGSKSLARFDFLLKGREINSGSSSSSAVPSACSLQPKGGKYPKKPPRVPPTQLSLPSQARQNPRRAKDTSEEGIRVGEPAWWGLTHTERFLLEVLGQVRAAGDAVDVALQHVPTHLVIEGVTELIWDLEKR